MTVNTPIFPFPLYILYLFFLFYFFVRKNKIKKYDRKRSNKEQITHNPDNDNYACLLGVLIVIASPVFVIIFPGRGGACAGIRLSKLPVFIGFTFSC